MDTPDMFSQPAAPDQPSADADAVAALEQECHDLRVLFIATFVALLFLALAVNLFMFKQMRLAQHGVQSLRTSVYNAEDDFRHRRPRISQFIAQLQAYGASHRDFQTNILDRYRAVMPEFFSAPMPIGPRAPAPLPPGPGTLGNPGIPATPGTPGTPGTNPLAPRLPGK